jgi:hypothetical protein
MCYVHVTALVAEYLTRKGKDALGPQKRAFRRIGRQGTAHTVGFLPLVAAFSCPTPTPGQSKSTRVMERMACRPSFVISFASGRP